MLYQFYLVIVLNKIITYITKNTIINVFPFHLDADVLDDDEEKERLKLLELEEKRKKSERRKVKFVKPDYLNVDGVEWDSYNHDYICFTYSSNKIYPNHFDPALHYSFSLQFNGKRWIIETFQVPNYEEILELYNSSNMCDKDVNSFLKTVLEIIQSNIDEQVQFKNQKMKASIQIFY